MRVGLLAVTKSRNAAGSLGGPSGLWGGLKPLREGAENVKEARAQVARFEEHCDIVSLARVAVGEDVPRFMKEQEAKGVMREANRAFDRVLDAHGFRGTSERVSFEASQYIYQKVQAKRRKGEEAPG